MPLYMGDMAIISIATRFESWRWIRYASESEDNGTAFLMANVEQLLVV